MVRTSKRQAGGSVLPLHSGLECRIEREAKVANSVVGSYHVVQFPEAKSPFHEIAAIAAEQSRIDQGLSSVDVTRVRVTDKEFNDAKKHGPHAEHCFFLLRNMRRESEHGTRNSPSLALSAFFLRSAGCAEFR